MARTEWRLPPVTFPMPLGISIGMGSGWMQTTGAGGDPAPVSGCVRNPLAAVNLWRPRHFLPWGPPNSATLLESSTAPPPGSASLVLATPVGAAGAATVVHCGGDTVSEVRITDAVLGKLGPVPGRQATVETTNRRIRGLLAAPTDAAGTLSIGVLHDRHITMAVLSEASQTRGRRWRHVTTTDQLPCLLSAGCINGRLAGGETVLCGDDGSAWRVDVDRNGALLPVATGANIAQPVFNCCITHQPRTVLLWNADGGRALDLRAPDQARLVFPHAAGHRQGGDSERFSAAAAHPTHPFQHVVSSTAGLLVYDLRQPGVPLLRWKHASRTRPADMLSVGTSSAATEIVASQRHPDGECFLYRYGSTCANAPPSSLGSSTHAYHSPCNGACCPTVRPPTGRSVTLIHGTLLPD